MIRTPKAPPAVSGKRSARAQYLRQLASAEEENRALRVLLRRAIGALRDVQRESANVTAIIQEIEKVS